MMPDPSGGKMNLNLNVLGKSCTHQCTRDPSTYNFLNLARFPGFKIYICLVSEDSGLCGPWFGWTLAFPGALRI